MKEVALLLTLLLAASTGHSGCLQALATSESWLVTSTQPVARRQQLDDQPQVSLAGRVSYVQSQCADVGGSTVSTFVVEDMPLNFSSASVMCKFLPLSTVRKLEVQATQNYGNSSFLGVAELKAAYFSEVVGAQGTPAHQLQLTPVDQQPPAVPATSYEVSCSVPLGQQQVVPSVMAQMLDADGVGDKGAFIITETNSDIVLSRVAVFSISPAVGPVTGGTEVHLIGEGFEENMQCLFHSSLNVVVVNATYYDTTNIVCTTPGLPNSEGTGEEVDLSVLWPEGCAVDVPFGFYSVPTIWELVPPTMSRYGHTEIVIVLDEDLLGLPNDTSTLLDPMVKVVGAAPNGTDLVLPANFSGDYDVAALTVQLPLTEVPYRTGSHIVEVSLNGQQFSGAPSNELAVLTIQGPLVRMARNFVQITANTTRIGVAVQLAGDNAFPVTASVALSHRAASGQQAPSLQNIVADNGNLSWDIGQAGQQRVVIVTLPPQSAQHWQHSALLVTIVNATHADVDSTRHTTSLTAAPASALQTSFVVQPNHVAYLNDSTSVPVAVIPATIPVPASLQYNIVAQTPAKANFLQPLKLLGYVRWDSQIGNSTQIYMPVEWAAVPPEAEYRLGMELSPLWNAAVSDLSNLTVLHIFGVPPYTCPPGTFLQSQQNEQPRATLAEAAVPSQLAVSDTQLEVMELWLDNGTVVELSSEFDPALSDYGAMVEDPVQSITLCLEAMLDDDAIKVFGPDSGLIAPYPAVPNFDSWADICNGSLWELPLSVGQNIFSIEILSAEVQALAPALLPDMKLEELETPSMQDSNETSLYTLSIVRLADPAHAVLSSLNATANGTTLLVCGAKNSSSTAQSAPTVPQCMPEVVLQLQVPAVADWVSLQPGLQTPVVQGIRVEVNGQVLSQGGDVGADKVTDTNPTNTTTQARSDPSFLPPAIILGLQPGKAMQIPVVVIAEDGVTSRRYYVSILRGLAVQPQSAGNDTGLLPVAFEDTLNSSLPAAPSNQPHAAPSSLPAGWPTPPWQQLDCSSCLPGWAAPSMNASFCTMCSPGTFSPAERSPECLKCSPGTYASSWGTTHCRHCILGTFAPVSSCRLCTMCPGNTTNLQDGSTSCPMIIPPGTDLNTRYAVVVSFGIFLTGTTLSEISSKVGVNASAEQILDSLVRFDTATAFNISLGDVSVTGIRQVARRVLYVNITASLPLDLPANATAEDIKAAMGVKSLSADDPISLLSKNPDKFFGRTTKALDVTANGDGRQPQRLFNRPGSGARPLAWYLILIICLATTVCMGLCAFGCRTLRRRSRRSYRHLLGRLTSMRLNQPIGTSSRVEMSAVSSAGLTVRSHASGKERILDTAAVRSDEVL